MGVGGETKTIIQRFKAGMKVQIFLENVVKGSLKNYQSSYETVSCMGMFSGQNLERSQMLTIVPCQHNQGESLNYDMKSWLLFMFCSEKLLSGLTYWLSKSILQVNCCLCIKYIIWNESKVLGI